MSYNLHFRLIQDVVLALVIKNQLSAHDCLMLRFTLTVPMVGVELIPVVAMVKQILVLQLAVVRVLFPLPTRPLN
ncbi:MAG: hypothetical protein ACO1NZ_17715 [Adhaeribacter sp.]